MMLLSEFLLQYGDEFSTFAELTNKLQTEAVSTGQLYFQVDIEPPQYNDRPDDWHNQLELAFESAR